MTTSCDQDMIKQLTDLVKEELTKHPPTIGLVGVSGVGKSSTINALFKTKLATSNTVACTKEFENIELAVTLTEGKAKGGVTALRVFDAPGLGEDVSKDEGYLKMYEEYLPQCDVVLWVMSARNRACALDQQYLARLHSFHDKIVFGINQVDLVEPMQWLASSNLPSSNQRNNIEIIRRDRVQKLAAVLGKEPIVVCYSSKHGYKLQRLFSTIVKACPPKREWIFANLKNFDHRDFSRINWTGKDGVLTHGGIFGFIARLFGAKK